MVDSNSDQLALTGFDAVAEPPPTDRLFFAILPDPDAVQHIERLAADLRSRLGLKGKPLGRARFHVTLYYLGEFAGLPGHVVQAAQEVAVAATLIPPFRLSFDRVASFSGRRRNKPLVLLGGAGLEAVRTFQQTLGLAMAKAGIGKPEAGYTPHLTLLYDDRQIPDRRIEPISWTASELVLVRSLIGEGRHEVIARLPLGR